MTVSLIQTAAAAAALSFGSGFCFSGGFSGINIRPIFITTIKPIMTIKVFCQYITSPEASKESATFNSTNPPSLNPVHQPITVMAAPAVMLAVSLARTCSIRKASRVISCDAEAIAMTKPRATINVKSWVGDNCDHNNNAVIIAN